MLINCSKNNSVVHQIESFKYLYWQHRNSFLTGMVTILVEGFLPDKTEKQAVNKTKRYTIEFGDKEMPKCTFLCLGFESITHDNGMRCHYYISILPP